MSTRVYWGAVAAALLVLLSTATGCARARRLRAALDPGPAPAVRPTESRIDVVLGETLVVPVALDGAVNPAREIRVRLDDGRRLAAGLYWISVRPDPVEPSWGWLAPVGRWEATPAEAGSRPSATGTWALVMDLPLNAVGQGLWIGSERTALNWLPDPAMVRAQANEGPWRLPYPGALGAPLLALAAPEARSPVRRWRYRLLLEGLSPETRGSTPGQGRFENPVIEALARQTEARWRIALAMLWGADAELCDRVKGRLAGVVDFGGGQFAPAWPADQAALGILLAELVAPKLEGPRRAERAAAWLETLPPALAWVVDDAGLRDAIKGRAVSTFGVANLTERATLAWPTSGRDAGATPDLLPLPAREARQITVEAPAAPEPQPGAGAAPVVLHAGRWSAVRTAAAAPLPAIPPGVRIGALAGDWTMEALVSGPPDAVMAGAPEWATAGLLYRAAEAGDRWYLYLECARAEDRPETVRVWLGAWGSPVSVLRISSDGSSMDEQAGAMPPGPDRPRVSVQAGKWTARVPIPIRAIEGGKALRIAVERTDARGRRSAWPRPMLPWQAEPGRVAADLSAWGGISPQAGPTPASTTR